MMSSSPLAGNSSLARLDEDSDDDMDWEEIAVPLAQSATASEGVPDYSAEHDQDTSPSTGVPKPGTGNIEITLKKVSKPDVKKKKQAEQSAEFRALRLTCHKVHTICLLASAIIRNKWINDPLLHARLLSLTPMSLQSSFAMITKKRHPDAAKRGRLFESAIMRLTQWWHEEFFEIEGYGHIKSRTFDEVQKVLFEVDFEDDEGEVIRSSKSLMKHALKRRGSRDVSSQLFTAVCRALGIPARLVVSLQSVPWQASVGKPKPPGRKPSRKGKDKANVYSDSEPEGSDVGLGDDDMEEVSIPEFGTGKDDEEATTFPGDGQTLSGMTTPNSRPKEKPVHKHVVKLRKSKSSGQRLGSIPSSRHTPVPPVGGYPPVFWTEVFSRPDGRWMPVDPTRYIVNKRKMFEPPSWDRNNRMVYVVAIEEDSYCRDVTPRYARDYGTKTSKAQLGGKGRRDWWESVMASVTRPYRLVRDDVEDEEFEYNKYTEGMPTSIAGFKNHPLYVLEQHLKREEVIIPKTEIGKFRGEPVYSRSNVVPLKTAENWMRMGRRVKEGAQALKWVKQRAMTIHRRRAMELAQQQGDEMLQGLYSEVQTELYIPDPVLNGVVPKNDFGNIDLYTPSMLPKGAALIPYKGAAKIAKRLGFDYAEAVTNFEFKKGRAFPVISGIVVASENEEATLEAYWEAEREAELKERAKRKERVIKRWTRLINGLRIRQRLQEQYASGGGPSSSSLRHDNGEMTAEIEHSGGFLTEADAVVQPFHLPRFEHSDPQQTFNMGTAAEHHGVFDEITTNGNVDLVADTQPPRYPNLGANLDKQDDDDDDDDLEEILPMTNGQIITSADARVPKSMRELATSAAQTELGATVVNGGVTQTPAQATFETSEQRNSHAIRLSGEQDQIPSGTETRPSKGSIMTRARRRRATGPKRKGSAPPFSSNEFSDEEQEDANDGPGGIGEDVANPGQYRTDAMRLNSKRRRSEMAPPPSDRVLRTRVAKSAVQLKAEKEAEAAYRQAITE